VADSKSLGIIGFAMGGVTALIMMIGTIVVQGHVDGRFRLDDGKRPVLSASLPTIVR